MSRTIRGEKGPGFEYGGRRKSKLLFQDAPVAKHFTHRAERVEAREQVDEGWSECQSFMTSYERAKWFLHWADNGDAEWFTSLMLVGNLTNLCHPLDALRGVKQDERHHPEGDAYCHTLCVIDAMKQIVDACGINYWERQILMMAALCHDFGKAATTRWNEEKGTWTAYGHDHVGAKLTYEWLQRELCWSDPNALAVTTLVDQHMVHVRPAKDHTAKAANKILVKLREGGVTWQHLVLLMLADCNGRPPLPTGLPAGVAVLNERIREIDPLKAIPNEHLSLRENSNNP